MDSNGSVAGGVDYFYNIYQGSNVALEIHDVDGLAEETESPHLEHRYLYGAAVDEILASDDGSNVLWGLGDHEGTVRDIVNNSGSVVDHRQYDSFGNDVTGSAPATDFIFGYTGQALDRETGLLDYGHYHTGWPR